MTNHQLLDMIGDARGEFLLEAQQHRETQPQGKRLNRKRIWLVVAIVALMLLLVGCAVVYAQGWLGNYFSEESGRPLSDSQQEFLQENEQIIAETQTENGWTVEMRSAMNDGSKAYIVIGITAPEGTNLTPRTKEVPRMTVALDWFGPGNASMSGTMQAILAKEEPKPVLSSSEGVQWNGLTLQWREDGDGKDNTKNYVIQVNVDREKSAVDPFGPEAQWHIHIENIVREYDDEDYKQELMDTKYKGQTDIMFTHEETQRMQCEEILVEGIWDFTIRFEGSDGGIELLSSPIKTEAEILRRYGEGIEDSACFVERVKVSSFVLRALSATITYEDCNGSPTFRLEDAHPHAVMDNGSEIELRDYGSSGESYKILEAESPIVLDEVDHIRMPDGTRVYLDGTVKTPERVHVPQTEAPQKLRDRKTTLAEIIAYYQQVQSETGVFGYRADFDGDDAEDLAIWYDGAFYAVCLMDESNVLQKMLTFDVGADVHQTYNQRAEEIFYEPNLIQFSEITETARIQKLYYANEKGLTLCVGVKAEGEKYYQLSENERNWEPIAAETYERIVSDYQRMDYHLRPIEDCYSE